MTIPAPGAAEARIDLGGALSKTDVIVVGGGNAALCAALSARQAGANAVVLERAPEEERGGNSAYSGGAFRVVYNGLEDIRGLVPDLSDSEIAESDFGDYTRDKYFDDMARLSKYRANPELVEALIDRSYETLSWMRTLGVRFVPIYGRQAFKVDGKFKFWGGLTLEVSGGGRGLMDYLYAAADKLGVEVKYGARATSLLWDGARVRGVRFREGEQMREIEAGAVILGSGGFHANAEWRARYLGRDWDLAKARGSRFNTGDGIQMALDIGAMSYGHWSGCHSVNYDRNAPEFGEPNLLSQQKNSFPFGILVNSRGERFVDEGADFRNYTYAQMGRWILEQPGALAWQVFDQRVVSLLTDEYRIRQITKVEAATLEELATKMEDVDPQGFLREIGAYNDAVRQDVPFNPAVKDKRCTVGLRVNKSNWANPLDKPPFVAFGVTCGVTFTYGGLRINTGAQVLSAEGPPFANLYATGELVGGLYYHDYPGGAGLTAGSVFGRLAGVAAAALTR
jgi:tricarballylate dehydrogenase